MTSAPSQPGDSSALGALRWLPYPVAVLLLSVLGVLMLRAVAGLPEGPLGLASEVQTRIDDAGVAHPVTAVLLNFRAYDTWLEIVVLLIAVVAVLATRRSGLEEPGRPSGLVVRGLTQRLFPVIALVTFFLLGLGTASPGGAFQAGALLAAGLYLLHLSAYPVTRMTGELAARLPLVAGTIAFLAVGVVGVLLGVRALELDPEIASWVIVAVEVAATVSIAVTLAAMLIGAAPEGDGATNTGVDGGDGQRPS